MKTAADEQDVTLIEHPNRVFFDTPVKRGNTVLEHIDLRKPSAGELRGISLADLAHLDVASLIKLLPRISPLTAPEAAGLEPADLMAIGAKVIDFLLQKRAKTDAFLAA